MSRTLYITTTDNPYDPSVDWDQWYFYDLSQGYCTCERLANLARTSDELSENTNAVLLEEAIDQLVENSIAISKTGKIVGFKKLVKENS